MRLEYKRGTAFSFSGVLKNKATGEPVPLDGYTIESQVRTWRNGRVGPAIGAAPSLSTEILGGTGNLRVYVDDVATTADWAIGAAVVDVVLTPTAGPRMVTKGYVHLDVVDASTQAVAP